MIRFGPAGIPLSCKGRTLKDGIEDVHNLSLSALEIQMVRSGTYPRAPDDEEVGMTIRDITEDFVVEAVRDEAPIDDPNEPIEEDDDLLFMPSPVAKTFGSLRGLGHMAKRMDVNLSIHTPYYMDLGGGEDDDLTFDCMESIRHAAIILNELDGDIVVTSLGIYEEGRDRQTVDENIYSAVGSIVDWWDGVGLKPRLGIEITGHQDVFGSIEQILDLCQDIGGPLVPVINFPHHHSRTGGSLMEAEDFLNLMEQVEPYCKGPMHTEFAGVEYQDHDEKRTTPIKKGDLRFEPLAEALSEDRPECTIISTSPLLEHDAMYMKIIQERILAKKAAKALKERRKAESAAAAASGERFGDDRPDTGGLQVRPGVHRSVEDRGSGEGHRLEPQGLRLRLRQVRPGRADVRRAPGAAGHRRPFRGRDDHADHREGRPDDTRVLYGKDLLRRADGEDRQPHRVEGLLRHGNGGLPPRARQRLLHSHGRPRRRGRPLHRAAGNNLRGLRAPPVRPHRRRDHGEGEGHRGGDAQPSRHMGATSLRHQRRGRADPVRPRAVHRELA